jgi:PAS domain S-box-containing protein
MPNRKTKAAQKTGNALKTGALKIKETRRAERLRLRGRVADLSKSKGHLEEEVRRQTDELRLKKGQLKQGVEKQKRSEEQIHIRTKAMESTVDGIFIIDAQQNDFPVSYANPSFQTMTGFGKREIIGRNYFSLYGAAADPRIIDEIKSTIQQGKSFHGEMLSFQKNGKKFWNLLRIAPVRDISGDVTHYVGLQTDISLMRQRDLEIKEQREELLHVTRVGKLAEFVSSLAHEISQPLTAILSYAQAGQRILANSELSRSAAGDAQLKEIFQYIISDDQRAAEVIRRLRSLLKKSEPEMKPIDINTLIHETVVLIDTDLKVRNNNLKTDLQANLPVIDGDRIQLQQVLLNLISNSFDAIESGQGAREMLIRTSCRDQETILVEVVDSGCGIPEQNLSKLFGHFFTSKPDGLGMGLSISRSIVEAHGGKLEMKNNAGVGATFYFTLPANRKKE